MFKKERDYFDDVTCYTNMTSLNHLTHKPGLFD